MKQLQIAEEVNNSCGIPEVVGFIDGTHIRLTHASNEENDYYNRKGYPSIQLQVVVDNDLLTTSVYTAWPGCTHDARVLRNSALYQKAEAGALILENHHILADNAYPLKNWLISPVNKYGNLSPQTIRFNEKLPSARQTIEKAFGIMRSRFRILRDMPVRNTEVICKLILTTCKPHNMCIMHSDRVDEQLQDEDMEPNNCEGVFQNGVNGVLRRAELIQLV